MKKNQLRQQPKRSNKLLRLPVPEIPEHKIVYDVQATGPNRLNLLRKLILDWREDISPKTWSIENALLCCRGMHYKTEPGEIYRSPDIFLENGGDCDDFVIFLGCLLQEYLVAPIHLVHSIPLHVLLFVCCGGYVYSLDGSAYASRDQRASKREIIEGSTIEILERKVVKEYGLSIQYEKEGFITWVHPIFYTKL